MQPAHSWQLLAHWPLVHYYHASLRKKKLKNDSTTTSSSIVLSVPAYYAMGYRDAAVPGTEGSSDLVTNTHGRGLLWPGYTMHGGEHLRTAQHRVENFRIIWRAKIIWSTNNGLNSFVPQIFMSQFASNLPFLY